MAQQKGLLVATTSLIALAEATPTLLLPLLLRIWKLFETKIELMNETLNIDKYQFVRHITREWEWEGEEHEERRRILYVTKIQNTDHFPFLVD